MKKTALLVLVLITTLGLSAQTSGMYNGKYYTGSKSYTWWSGGRFNEIILPSDTSVNKLGLAAVNGVLYLGDGTKWTASASGTSNTFSNGLTELAGVVKLGGRLTNSTNISGRFLYDLYLDSLSSFNLKTSGNLFFYHNNTAWLMLLSGAPVMVFPDGTGQVGVSLASDGISLLGGVGSSLTMKSDSSRVTKRISYSQNRGSTFTQFSLVDKNYVDSVKNTISGGGLIDGDYGNITVSGTGTAMTINNGEVVNIMLADMPAHTFKGNKEAVTDVTQNLTIAEMQAELQIKPNILSSVSTNTTVTSAASIYIVSTPTTDVTMTVNPANFYSSGLVTVLRFKKITNNAYTVIITPTSGSINGASSYSMALYNESVTVISDGTNLYTF